MSGDLSAQQKEDLGRVLRAARHLLALISDVIDISKIEAGRIAVVPESFDLEALAREAVDTIRTELEAKGLELVIEAREWPQLITDRKRLLQCLLNYFSNAVKYTETGRIRLEIRSLAEEVEIAVRDTGIGIAETDMPKLFEAFERIDSHLRVKAGGTGLGLYLTRKIATEILRGSAWAESLPGRGSSFYLRIPREIERPTAEVPA